MTLDGLADLNRRMDKVEAKLDWLDEHGTRAVGALQIQVSELIRDSAKIEAKVGRVWPNIVALIAALLPLYALVIALLVQHPGG